MDTLLEVMELEGEQSEYARETFSHGGAEIRRWGKSIEPYEGLEAEKANSHDIYKDTPSDEARIQKPEEMVHQLQETIGELEEQLNFAIDQRKEEEQGTMTEQL